MRLQSPATTEDVRILLYSHDSYGLGHLRRTLTIASALATTLPGASLLIATGSSCATRFNTPPGIDIVKLPSATKDARGSYTSRTLTQSLESLTRIRSELLTSLVKSFRPHLLLVDNKVLGLNGELEGALGEVKRLGTKTILGIRDILDDAVVVAREWGCARVRRALIEDYDRVCVYGTPEVFDPRVEYPIPPELRERVEFTGYVVRPETHISFPPVPMLRPKVLVTVGGGEDGADRVETYLEAIEGDPPPWDSTIVLGPLLDRSRARGIKARARVLGHAKAHLFYEDMPRLFGEASAIVAMAGYNSAAEILRSRLPAVLLPRCFPRKEQLIRARRLADLGFVDHLPSATPEGLRRAVESALNRGRHRLELPPLDGAERLSRVAAELLSRPSLGAESLSS